MTTSFFEATPQIRRWTDALRELAESEALPARAGRWIASIAAFFIIIQYVPPLAYHLSINNIVSGIALGSLYGIIGVGIVLIYKTNRIINFAAGAIGAVPATAALMLTIQGHLSYLAALPIAVIGGPLVGALTDMVVMRRFAKSPRLILTVVTLGVAQSLAILSFYIPIWLGARAGEIARVQTPWINWAINDSRGQPIIRGDQIFALIVVCALTAMLAFFLRYTRLGIALRASAENADRAELLGIPVRRVGMVAWMLAGLLSALAIYVQSPLIGIPQDATLGFDTLLYGLAAAIVARMQRLSVCLAAGMGIGVIIFGSIASTGSSNLASATMLVVILGALLLVRKGLTRAQDSGVSTWQSVKEYRRIPHELNRLWEVQLGRVAVVAAAVGLAVLLPFIIGAPDIPSLTLLPLYGIVAVSLVVLTGWAGQISLGQFAVVGMAAAVSGGMIANHNIDFFVALALAVATGVVTAVVIGLPALRIQGLYLAAATLAFGYAVQNYLLDSQTTIGSHIMPGGYVARVNRPMLYGFIDLESDRTFYFLCLAFLGAAMLAAYSFRRNRSGRVLMAVRDNQRGASAYAVSAVRNRLAAFAVSGGLAGVAGLLWAYAQHNVIKDSYQVPYSIIIFLACVLGGLTSVSWAVVGAIGLEAWVVFAPKLYGPLGQEFTYIIPLLLTGPLLILNMMITPGGAAQTGFEVRDTFLRWVARRRNLVVPSLIADRRIAEVDDSREVIEAAEHHVAIMGSGNGSTAEPVVACPVCAAVLPLASAAEHEHLRAGAAVAAAPAAGAETVP